MVSVFVYGLYVSSLFIYLRAWIFIELNLETQKELLNIKKPPFLQIDHFWNDDEKS